MGAISRRTVFYETGKDGEFRFHDWAMVNTKLGMMMEPRIDIMSFFNSANSGAIRDFTDEITRIDEISPMSLDRNTTILSDTPITGGYLVSRKGR